MHLLHFVRFYSEDEPLIRTADSCHSLSVMALWDSE